MSKTNDLRSEYKLAKTYDKCVSGKPILTVVLIHGIASDSSTFRKMLEYFEGTKILQNVRFVTFDLLGAGESDKSDDYNYDYTEQLEALHNSIEELNLGTPLVLVGHSMGTLIATRYAKTYKRAVHQLILMSPPIYTEEDLDNPAFAIGMKMFCDAVSAHNPDIVTEKSFINSLRYIVQDRKNYKTLCETKVPTTMIYGLEDQFIGAQNIPKLIKDNPKYIVAQATPSKHGITHDKYAKVAAKLGEIVNEKI